MNIWLQRTGAALGACVVCVIGTRVSAQAPAPAAHVVRIASGPSGTDTNGTFILTEQRTSFNRQSDREVIVLLEWDGVAGRHTLVAQWRGPDGTAISTSPIDGELKGAPIVPFSLVRVSDAPARPMAELRAAGELIAPLTGNENVMSAGFARGLDRSNAIAPADQRWEFARSEPGFIVFLTWNPRQRTKGMSVLRLYDADNRVVVQSKPAKVDIRKGDLKLSSWDLPMLTSPGVFRADVLIDEKPVWRGFVRITP